MITQAKHYAKQRRSRSAIYAANRFARLVDDRAPAQLTDSAISEYAEQCRQLKLSPATIKSSVKYLIALAREHGAIVNAPKIRLNQPHPQPVQSDSLDAIWVHLPPWTQQFTVLSYWTGLRLSDVLQLQLNIWDGAEFPKHIRHTASKTGRRFSYPIPQWLHSFLCRVPLPFGSPADWAGKLTRGTLRRACNTVAIPPVLPKHIRQRSITAWKTADATAGSIIHGSGLGILDHYVDPLTILTAAAPKVRLPDCFGASQDQPDIMPLFRQLDPAGQQLILSTMERMA